MSIFSFLIAPNFVRILCSKQNPEFVLISANKQKFVKTQDSIKYKWLLKSNESLDLKLFKQINKKVKPDAFLLQSMEAKKVRLILRNRNNTKILNLHEGVPQKLSISDLVKKSNLYVDKQYLNRIAVLLQGGAIDRPIRKCFEQVEWSEVNQALFRTKKDWDYDAIVDLTCLNGALYEQDRVKLSVNAIKAAKAKDIPFFVITPVLCTNRTIEVYTRVYEVLTQQYANTKIVRIPSVLHAEADLKSDAIQNWSRIEDLLLYLNYAASIKESKIIELNDGEYFFNKDLNLLIEELGRM